MPAGLLEIHARAAVAELRELDGDELVLVPGGPVGVSASGGVAILRRNDRRSQIGHQSHGVTAVLGLAHYFHVILTVDQPSQSITNESMIVREDDAQRLFCRPLERGCHGTCLSV